MNLKEILAYSSEKLKIAGIDSPAFEVGVIVCTILSKDRGFLYSHLDDVLTEKEEKLILDTITTRATRVPMQYIFGYQEFMSLKFNVNENVLIPRQDTEILVESVIEQLKRRKESEKYLKVVNGLNGLNGLNELNDLKVLKVLDIGTGSGCIAISIAKYVEDVLVTALDKSFEALEVAKSNAKLNNIEQRIRFIQSDLFSNLNECDKFDCIVSNPPYIPSKDILDLEVEVKIHEPLSALDGGVDGLDFYKEIIKRSPKFLEENGLLAFEVGISQANEVADLMRKDYDNIKIIKDYGSVDRVVQGALKSSKS